MNQFHKVYDLSETYHGAAETNNRPTSDKAAAATMFCWFWVFFNFVYGITELCKLSLFERYREGNPGLITLLVDTD